MLTKTGRNLGLIFTIGTVNLFEELDFKLDSQFHLYVWNPDSSNFFFRIGTGVLHKSKDQPQHWFKLHSGGHWFFTSSSNPPEQAPMNQHFELDIECRMDV